MRKSWSGASTFRLTASDGCGIAGSRCGLADGPAVVLAHPIGFDGRFWNDTAMHLRADYSVLLPDARGHGTSDRGDGETSVERMALDIVEMLDAQEIARAGFVGCSMGACVGMHLAAAHGARFEWFVFANAPARIALPRELFDAGIQAARSGGYAGLVRGLLPRWISAETIAARPEWFAALQEDMLSTDPDGFADAFAALRNSDRTGELSAIRHSCLVVTGEQDHGFAPDAARAMANVILGAVVAIVAGAAHLVPAEQPEIFATLLRDFAAPT